MSKKKHARKQLFVDPKVQGALIARAGLYWAVCLITITLMLLCWRILTNSPQPFFSHLSAMWSSFGPALVASCVLLPLVVVDIIRVSNRFAGPLVRLRRSMRALAQGEEVRPLQFRQGDFWQEFADEFNAIIRRVESLQLDAGLPDDLPADAGPEDDVELALSGSGDLTG